MDGLAQQPAASGRSSLTRRAVLVLVLWLGFWLLGLGLVGALLAVPVIEFQLIGVPNLDGIVCACVALTLAYSLRPRRVRDDAADVVHRPLRRDEAPQLFAFLERIAVRLGVHAPVEIYLATAATASISAVRSWTGRVRRLEVRVGLPLFAWLSERELGAVFVHEFGHFIGGDVALAPWIYRTRTAIGAAVHALDDSFFLLDRPFRAYGNWFMRLSGAVSRSQEYAADALGARLFGGAAMGAALEKVDLVGPGWHAYFHHDLVPALDCGVRVPVFEGFRRFCAASPKRLDVQGAIDKAGDRAVTPYDTHPSLAERLAALAVATDVRVPRPASCVDLLGGEAHIEALWYARIGAGTWPATNWDDFGDAGMRTRLERRFAATAMAPEHLPLTDLPAIVQSLDEWWARLRPEGVSFLSQEGRRRYVLGIVHEWVMASLCHAGFALRVRPGLPPMFERDGITVESAALMAAACAGALSAAELARYLRRA
jgi:Zn-dependent protease with chaperone function